MTTQPISDDSPGTDLFPEYASLYELVCGIFIVKVWRGEYGHNGDPFCVPTT